MCCRNYRHDPANTPSPAIQTRGCGSFLIALNRVVQWRNGLPPAAPRSLNRGVRNGDNDALRDRKGIRRASRLLATSRRIFDRGRAGLGITGPLIVAMGMTSRREKAQGEGETAGLADVSMLPERRERPPLESAFVRVIATSGVVGIGVALGAILSSQEVAGWTIGLVIGLVSVILSAILWSSRRL